MVAKRSKKMSKKDFYLWIISSISKNNSLPKLHSNISKQNLNYYVKSLKINGLITYKGYATWDITELGKVYLNQKEVKNFNLDTLVQPTPFKISKSKKQTTWKRTHGLMWSIKCPASYSRLTINRILESKKLNPVITGNKTIKISLHGNNIHFNKETITIWFDKMFYFKSKTATEGYKLAVYELKRLIVSIERLLGVSLRIRGLYKFKSCKKHFGDVNNELAKLFTSKNKTLRIFDEGKEWLLIDFSDSQFQELETTDNERNIVDMDNVVNPFFNTLRHNPTILNNISNKISNIENENKRLISIIEDQQKILSHLLTKDEKAFINFR